MLQHGHQMNGGFQHTPRHLDDYITGSIRLVMMPVWKLMTFTAHTRFLRQLGLKKKVKLKQMHHQAPSVTVRIFDIQVLLDSSIFFTISNKLNTVHSFLLSSEIAPIHNLFAFFFFLFILARLQSGLNTQKIPSQSLSRAPSPCGSDPS